MSETYKKYLYDSDICLNQVVCIEYGNNTNCPILAEILDTLGQMF